MPTKRQRRVRPFQHRITERAIEAFRAGESLVLHRELGLRPWEVSPLDARLPEPPEFATYGYEAAHELWLELLAAVNSGVSA